MIVFLHVFSFGETNLKQNEISYYRMLAVLVYSVYRFAVKTLHILQTRDVILYCYKSLLQTHYQLITLISLKAPWSNESFIFAKRSDVLQLTTKLSIFVQFTDNGSPRRSVQTPREVSQVPASTPETRDTTRYHADVGGVGGEGEQPRRCVPNPAPRATEPKVDIH